MKRLASIVLALILMLTFVATGYCDGAVIKLVRGMSNIVTSPIEIFYRISEAYKSDGVGNAVTYGLLKGICMFPFRATMGIYEVLTFPVPIPEDYEPVITDPEFFWEWPGAESGA